MKVKKMTNEMIPYILIGYCSIVVSSISQVLLKKESQIKHSSAIGEYLNIKVITAYGLFFFSTLLTMLAYRKVPLSMGPIFDCGSYILIIALGVRIFHERLTKRKIIAMAILLLGIIVYAI